MTAARTAVDGAERHAEAGASILGMPVQRREDPTLLRGEARFTADLAIDGLTELVMVRSTVAHGRIAEMDMEAARRAPGVIAVLSSGDLALPPSVVSFLRATMPEVFWQPPLAGDTVHFVGQPIAVIVAESRAAAIDAAALFDVDYEAFPAVVGIDAAIAEGATLAQPAAGTNVAVRIPLEAGPEVGPGTETVSVSARLCNPRMAVAPMECNALAVCPGAPMEVWASTQTPHGLRDFLAAGLGLSAADVIVRTPAVGGGFGAKGAWSLDYLVVAATAQLLNRPVRWVQERADNLVGSTSRDQVQTATLTATPDGQLLALDVLIQADAGAYPGVGAFLPMMTRLMAVGVYEIPRVTYRIEAIATNTAPTVAFRGAGRPEAAALIERMVDLLAAELEMDPVALRRRNLIPPDAFPYTTAVGSVYDCGDYEAALDAVLELAGWEKLRADQADRRAGGGLRQLGIGLSVYVEVTAGGEGTTPEYGSVAIGADGRVSVASGTSAHGQGHGTTFAQIVSSVLGIDPGRIELLQGDTSRIPQGGGTQGSRSVQAGGSAVFVAAEAVLDKARRLAAHLLEADPADVVVTGSGLGIAGVPARDLTWGTLASASENPALLPLDMEPGLSAAPGFTQPGPTYPFGAHVAVVEVDMETGKVDLIRLIAVDDCGTVINPLLADGQVHGGLAAGAAQALWEFAAYDPEGNPLTASFADYGLPSAAELPSFETGRTVTPTPKNPLGAKGIGESGTIGSTPAVQNAVVDALAHLGVRHVDMPLSPERVWRAIQQAAARP